jgi:hypothetical protein
VQKRFIANAEPQGDRAAFWDRATDGLRATVGAAREEAREEAPPS